MSVSSAVQAGWIHTFTGRQFWPLDARASNVDILDIAHALSCTGRFGGHTREFYSVAQHSVLASVMLVDKAVSKWALLHDAPEAYLGDVPRPIKYSLGFDEYRAAEDRLMEVVMEAFDLGPEPPEVEWADATLLVTEARDLMQQGQVTEEWLHGARKVPPLDGVIVPWEPRRAESEFLKRWYEVR